jgi:hypothetical protein
MKNIFEDSHAMEDSMTDFANQYGDQALIQVMRKWLSEKMGNYTVLSAERCRISSSRALNDVADILSEEAARTKLGSEYLMGLTKALLEITKRMWKL